MNIVPFSKFYGCFDTIRRRKENGKIANTEKDKFSIEFELLTALSRAPIFSFLFLIIFFTCTVISSGFEEDEGLVLVSLPQAQY